MLGKRACGKGGSGGSERAGTNKGCSNGPDDAHHEMILLSFYPEQFDSVLAVEVELLIPAA